MRCTAQNWNQISTRQQHSLMQNHSHPARSHSLRHQTLGSCGCCSHPAFTTTRPLPCPGPTSQGQTAPPVPSSPFSLRHSRVVQTPGNATRWIRAQTKLLLASCDNTTGLWIPCSIGWKQQRGTARLVLKAEVLSQTTYHLKNLLCSSDMCYFPIIRN